MSGRLFADRTDAGRALARHLAAWAGTNAVVCGIPRGGVVVAAEVAKELALPLDVVVVRKLGSTSNPEYAVGAVADDVRIVDPDAVRLAGMSGREVDDVEAGERIELGRRMSLFAAHSTPLTGREVIVVDDGIATGATAEAACRAVRRHGAAYVELAVPVAPAPWRPAPDAVDEYVCLHAERDFWAVGQYYRDFTQTTDAEVLALLDAHR